MQRQKVFLDMKLTNLFLVELPSLQWSDSWDWLVALNPHPAQAVFEDSSTLISKFNPLIGGPFISASSVTPLLRELSMLGSPKLGLLLGPSASNSSGRAL